MNANSSAVASIETQSSSRGLRIALWVAQSLLAAAFLGAGLMKLGTPIEQLAQNMGWVNSVPAALVRFIGASEVAGALGLLLPAITRIKPVLTGLAGLGLLVVMVLAVGVHVVRGEFNMMPPSIVLGALSAFVAWGRLKKAPIHPRA